MDELVTCKTFPASLDVCRPVGTLGVPISLQANLLKLDFPENLKHYDYKVKIKPDICGDDMRIRRRVYKLVEYSAEVSPF